MQEGCDQESMQLRTKRAKEKMVEVQGGCLVRSTGRKDSHSKVCTAKGPRDRRVRLSATTAIQFYDVQDRLGYDRPSKAIDWLMNEAKAAIDALSELPAKNTDSEIITGQDIQEYGLQHIPHHTQQCTGVLNAGCKILDQLDLDDTTTDSFGFITVAADAAGQYSIDFQDYPNDHHLKSRIKRQAQDSLLSFQDEPFSQHHLSPIPADDQHHHHHHLISASSPLNFDAALATPEFQRMMTRNANSREIKNMANYSLQWQMQPILGQQHQFCSQREPLQSSTHSSPSNHLYLMRTQQMPTCDPSPITSIGLISDGFVGFSLTPQIHGPEEESNPVSSQPTSATSFAV